MRYKVSLVLRVFNSGSYRTTCPAMEKLIIFCLLVCLTIFNDIWHESIFHKALEDGILFWERASVSLLMFTAKQGKHCIFITSLVWRGPWLEIEPWTSDPVLEVTRLSRRRYISNNFNRCFILLFKPVCHSHNPPAHISIFWYSILIASQACNRIKLYFQIIQIYITFGAEWPDLWCMTFLSMDIETKHGQSWNKHIPLTHITSKCLVTEAAFIIEASTFCNIRSIYIVFAFTLWQRSFYRHSNDEIVIQKA